MSTGTEAECRQRYTGGFLGVSAHSVVEGAQFVASGAVSFARGLNDTPKIFALLLAASAMGKGPGLVAVAAVMAVGGILGARRVAETVSKKITPMSPGQGLVASVGTATLVIAASLWKLPVSTGNILGVGLVKGTARWKMLGAILAAWLITLPLAAALGAAAFAVLRRV